MKFLFVIILLIIILNAGFSYQFFTSVLYGNDFESFDSAISKLFNSDFEKTGIEYHMIGDILKSQPDIKNSYVMGETINYAYYAGSKFLYTDFRAGSPSDSIEEFIERKNWSEYDVYISNIHSYPRDKDNLIKPIPDYIVYRYIPFDDNTPWYQRNNTHTDVSFLTNPSDSNIPSNFELLFQSNKTGTFVYKIHKSK